MSHDTTHQTSSGPSQSFQRCTTFVSPNLLSSISTFSFATNLHLSLHTPLFQHLSAKSDPVANTVVIQHQFTVDERVQKTLAHIRIPKYRHNLSLMPPNCFLTSPQFYVEIHNSRLSLSFQVFRVKNKFVGHTGNRHILVCLYICG